MKVEWRLTHEEIMVMREALDKLRHGFPVQWTVGKGPCGQDKYVGLPPGMCLVDQALQILDYVQMRQPLTAQVGAREEKK